jgi:hypothetical protein
MSGEPEYIKLEPNYEKIALFFLHVLRSSHPRADTVVLTRDDIFGKNGKMVYKFEQGLWIVSEYTWKEVEKQALVTVSI